MPTPTLENVRRFARQGTPMLRTEPAWLRVRLLIPVTTTPRLQPKLASCAVLLLSSVTREFATVVALLRGTTLTTPPTNV